MILYAFCLSAVFTRHSSCSPSPGGIGSVLGALDAASQTSLRLRRDGLQGR